MTGLIELSTGGVLHSGRLIQVDAILTPDNTPGWYRSVYLFGNDGKAHVEKNKSLKGYKGVVGLDFVPIDFDRNPKTHPDLPESAPLDDLRALLMGLKGEGVNLDGLAIYFSGSKGYHVELPVEMIGTVEPSADIPARARALVEKITAGLKTVDLAIVGDHIRVWRVQGSVHEKTGLRKTRLTLHEVFDTDTAYHKQLANKIQIREWTAREEFRPDEYLSGLWGRPLIPTAQIKREPIQGGIFELVEGSRHKSAMRAAAILINRNDSNTVAQILRAAYPDLHAERPIDIPRIVEWLKNKASTQAENKGALPHINTLGDFADQIHDFYKNGYSQGYDTGWSSLNELYRPARGELTVVSGIPSHGKSEMMDAILINLTRKHGFKFGIFSPENFPFAIHFEKLASKIIGKPFHQGPTPRMSHAEIGEAMRFMAENYFWVNQGDRQLNLDGLLEVFEKAIVEKKLDGILVDPWNEIDHEHEKQENENDYITRALTKFRRFQRKHNIFGWIVAHPKKMQRTRNNGTIPDVTPYDITGSSAWYNKADNIIIVKRDFEAGTAEFQTHKIKYKVRGRIGSIIMNYDRATGIYSEVAGGLLA